MGISGLKLGALGLEEVFDSSGFGETTVSSDGELDAVCSRGSIRDSPAELGTSGLQAKTVIFSRHGCEDLMS